MISSRSALVAIPFVLTPLAGGASDVEPVADDAEKTAAVTEPLQLIDFLAGQAALAQDNSVASRATGALYVPFLNADHTGKVVTARPNPFFTRTYPVRGTCGVTVISPHHAITASHCVSDVNAYDPANQTFTVRTFDITTANGTQLLCCLELLGPVHTGASWANTKLCSDPTTAAPGAFGLTYTPSSTSRRSSAAAFCAIRLGERRERGVHHPTTFPQTRGLGRRPPCSTIRRT
ncbi:hypothetical protein BH11MYX4_BH11MYX4_18470 [soil metagenome]